jgi:hypothetical protein
MEFLRKLFGSRKSEKNEHGEDVTDVGFKEKEKLTEANKDLPSLVLIVCDNLPENKDAFVQSVLKSLQSPVSPGALIDLHQYNNAQTTEHAVPFAVALATRYPKEHPHFMEHSLELDVDRTIYEKVKTGTPTRVIQSHVFLMFFKAADLIGEATARGGGSPRMSATEMEEYWKYKVETSKEIKFSGKVKRCLNCSSEISDDMLQCSECGSGRFTWNEHSDITPKINAPQGVFCILCESRFSIEECIEPKVPEGRVITFICPKCKVPRAYDPSSDKGL